MRVKEATERLEQSQLGDEDTSGRDQAMGLPGRQQQQEEEEEVSPEGQWHQTGAKAK